jgi:hypothetical protein
MLGCPRNRVNINIIYGKPTRLHCELPAEDDDGPRDDRDYDDGRRHDDDPHETAALGPLHELCLVELRHDAEHLCISIDVLVPRHICHDNPPLFASFRARFRARKSPTFTVLTDLPNSVAISGTVRSSKYLS